MERCLEKPSDISLYGMKASKKKNEGKKIRETKSGPKKKR
jgi:hypothetical protein